MSTDSNERLQARIEAFVKCGPWTFLQARKLALACAETDGMYLDGALDACCHMFDEKDFGVIINPRLENFHTRTHFKNWVKGTQNWKVKNLTGEFKEYHLRLIAEIPTKDYIETFYMSEFDYEEKLALFALQNSHVRKRRQREHLPRDCRDASPVRK